MEHKKSNSGILDLMIQPAFTVKAGVVDRINEAAQQYFVEAGTPIDELLLTGKSHAALGRIPLGYALEDHTVTIERFAIEGSGDTGTLTNYRIQK